MWSADAGVAPPCNSTPVGDVRAKPSRRTHRTYSRPAADRAHRRSVVRCTQTCRAEAAQSTIVSARDSIRLPRRRRRSPDPNRADLQLGRVVEAEGWRLRHADVENAFECCGVWREARSDWMRVAPGEASECRRGDDRSRSNRYTTRPRCRLAPTSHSMETTYGDESADHGSRVRATTLSEVGPESYEPAPLAERGIRSRWRGSRPALSTRADSCPPATRRAVAESRPTDRAARRTARPDLRERVPPTHRG